jgi:hypothetical protein
MLASAVYPGGTYSKEIAECLQQKHATFPNLKIDPIKKN